MWDAFLIAYAFGAFALLVPGFFFFRALGFRWAVALPLAPVWFCSLLPLVCLAHRFLGVACTWVGVMAPIVLIPAVLLLVRIVATKVGVRGLRFLGGSNAVAGSGALKEWGILAAYAVVGVAATLWIFVLSLDGADSFVQEYDNVYHLASIRSFLDSGDWSCFSPAFYPESQSEVNPLPYSSFYPATWHAFCVMVIDALGVPVALSVNVVNSLFSSLVFPLGMYLLLTKVFASDAKLLLCGLVCSFAFASFPWQIMAWGPIFPNMAAYCLVPAAIFLFMEAVGDRMRFGLRISAIVSFVLGFVGIVLLQPNTVFTAAVFLVPYCCYTIYTRVRERYGSADAFFDKRAFAGVCLFLVFAAAVWVVAFKLPMFSATVNFSWASFTGRFQALVDVLVLSLSTSKPASIALAVLVIVGAVHSIRDKRFLWLVFSHVLMCALYVLSASTNGFLKQLLTGFWYTDPMRLSANIVFTGIPLACLGLRSVSAFFGGLLAKWYAGGMPSRRGSKVGALVVVLVVAAMVYSPNFQIYGIAKVETGIGYVRNFLEGLYSASEPNVLDPEERDFLEEVAEVVSDDDLILNEPNDGSAFAYSIYDMNVYYRAMDGYGNANESDSSRLIRTELDRIAEDPAVAEAVENVGAMYVLQLDQADYDRQSKYLFSYYPDIWQGIDGVDDSTPGFEAVLSEGDMRLYRIVL